VQRDAVVAAVDRRADRPVEVGAKLVRIEEGGDARAQRGEHRRPIGGAAQARPPVRLVAGGEAEVAVLARQVDRGHGDQVQRARDGLVAEDERMIGRDGCHRDPD
jgi:hypothetical protein